MIVPVQCAFEPALCTDRNHSHQPPLFAAQSNLTSPAAGARSGSKTGPARVQSLHCRHARQHLMTTCSTPTTPLLCCVLPTAAAGKGGLAGMVLEPCGRPATIAAGTCRGSLLFMDIRMASDPSSTLNSNTAVRTGPNADLTNSSDAAAGGNSGSSVAEQLSCCVVREVEAHSKVGMSVMVAHPTAPLLATGSTAQVVKVWNDNGDVVSALMGIWGMGFCLHECHCMLLLWS